MRHWSDCGCTANKRADCWWQDLHDALERFGEEQGRAETDVLGKLLRILQFTVESLAAVIFLCLNHHVYVL